MSDAASPLPNESDHDDELKHALAAAFGDDAMGMFDDDDDDMLGLASELDDEGLSPLIRFANELNHAIYFNDRPSVDNNHDAKQPSATADRFVVFSIGEKQYGLPLGSVIEIARCPDVTLLPRTPAWLRGVCNLRSQILSVVDLRCLFQCSSERPMVGEKIIVVRSQKYSATTAIVVDRIQGIRNSVTPRNILAQLTHAIAQTASGIATVDDVETVLIDPDKLFGCAELITFTH